MSEASPFAVTALLHQWSAGDETALERLMPLIYEELRRLAHGYLRSERPDHTLQATALVHEAYVRLVEADVPWKDRVHFFAVAAGLMRRILVDHAKARGRVKRGRGRVKVSLEEATLLAPQAPPDVLELDEVLKRLAVFDPRKAKTIELHFFGGLTYEETAAVLGISPATVHRELRLAKAWIHHELAS